MLNLLLIHCPTCKTLITSHCCNRFSMYHIQSILFAIFLTKLTPTPVFDEAVQKKIYLMTSYQTLVKVLPTHSTSSVKKLVVAHPRFIKMYTLECTSLVALSRKNQYTWDNFGWFLWDNFLLNVHKVMKLCTNMQDSRLHFQR